MSEVIVQFLISFLSAAAATFVFAIVLHAPKRAWLPSGLLGGFGFLLYCLCVSFNLSAALSMLLAATATSLTANILARHFRIISTVYLALAIIPLVPGYGLYQCMSQLGNGMHVEGLIGGTETMISFLMIAVGVFIGNFIFRMFCRKRPITKHSSSNGHDGEASAGQ